MNAATIAKALNGVEYPVDRNVTNELFEQAREAGLVIVFGSSDDYIEFRGAINRGVPSYGGGIAYLTSRGLLKNDCDDDRCPYFVAEQSKSVEIEAVWVEDQQSVDDDEKNYAWVYRTSIPHETFNVVEDGEPYCRGIVFALADVEVPDDDNSPPLSLAAIQWLANGKRGVSSNTIFTRLSGIDAMAGWPQDRPRDAFDLARCRLLLETVPEFGARFSEMSDVSPYWEALVRNWDDLCASLDKEAPNWRYGDVSVPKTYAMMLRIAGSVMGATG